ncbi:MAG: M23 family metallopeptidase [Opitutales bacterium]
MRFLVISLIALSALTASASDILWPTPSTAFNEGKHYKDFIQPTAIGNLEGGLFGDTRNSGYKFHEGIDIKSVNRNKSGHAQDDIFASIDGEIVLINHTAWQSNYGKYVVIEHNFLDVNVYTLYAHLSEVSKNLKVGDVVKAGTTLGTMGGTPNIAKAQEHLHFEIGLRMSDKFQVWYDKQKFGSKNYFGNYNGMNLSGFDALHFFEALKKGEFSDMKTYIQSLPTAFVVRVYTKQIPSFAKRYPALVDNNGEEIAWDIYFTWYGLVKKLERIKDPRVGAREGDCEVVKYNPNELKRKCKKLVDLNKDGTLSPNKELRDILQKLFL